MSQSPRITLVTPSFNSVETIERTLLSVQRQNYPNLQYICVDGASTDGTVAVLEKYRGLIDHIISEPDKNATDAVNKGFRLADGDILCYLNADDELADNALNTVANYFAQHPETEVITGSCRRIFADLSETVTNVDPLYLDQMALRNLVEQPSTFWRKELYQRSGEFDTSYYYAFDWEMWNRFKSVGARFLPVHEVLSVYHFCETNLTSRAGQKVVDEMFRVTRTYGPQGGLIAYAYKLIFTLFDLNGYCDQGIESLPWPKRTWFGTVRGLMGLVFGAENIAAYNWNWASKQIRGVVWYK